MRSVIPGLLWMVYWTVLAAGTPSFFPDWVQAATWAAGGTGAVLLIGWAKHVEVLNTRLTAKDDDIKRLETKNTELKGEIAELKNQLQSQPTLPPQSSPEPPKLLPTKAPINKPSQAELKMQALKTANALYSAIKEAKRQAGGAEVNVELLYETQLSDFRNTKYKHIVDSFLRYYSKDLHDSAVELKTKILVPEGMKLLGVGNYTNPQGLRDLEAIAQDLKNISTSPIAKP